MATAEGGVGTDGRGGQGTSVEGRQIFCFDCGCRYYGFVKTHQTNFENKHILLYISYISIEWTFKTCVTPPKPDITRLTSRTGHRAVATLNGGQPGAQLRSRSRQASTCRFPPVALSRFHRTEEEEHVPSPALVPRLLCPRRRGTLGSGPVWLHPDQRAKRCLYPETLHPFPTEVFTKHHTLGGLERNSFSHRLGGQKPQIGAGSSQGSSRPHHASLPGAACRRRCRGLQTHPSVSASLSPPPPCLCALPSDEDTV